MRIMFAMNATNSVPPALCPLPYLSFYLYWILLTLPHFHTNLFSISKKNLSCVCQTITYPSQNFFSFLFPSKKEASSPEWLVLSVSTSLHWHLWIKTIPCALLCVPCCVKSVTKNKHKIHYCMEAWGPTASPKRSFLEKKVLWVK